MSDYWTHPEHWWMGGSFQRVETLNDLPPGTVIGFPVGPRTGVLSIYEFTTMEDGNYWMCDGFPEPINDNDLPALLLWHPDMSGVDDVVET